MRRSLSTAARSHVDSLEPRTMLALAPVPGNRGEFTDTDGDRIVVQLTGPGALFVDDTSVNEGVGADATTNASRLSISVRKAGGGDGRMVLEGLSVLGALKSLSASAVDFQFDGVFIDGACYDAKIGDLLLGADFELAPGAAGNIKFSARRIDGGLLGSADLNFANMHVQSFSATLLQRGSLLARTIGTLKTVKSNLSDGRVLLFNATVSGTDDPILDVAAISIAGQWTNSEWFIDGNAGKVTVHLVQSSQFNGDGLLNSLTVKTDAQIGLNWNRIGKLTVGGRLGGAVNAEGVDALGVSIGSIKAKSTQQLAITTALAPLRGDTTFNPRVGIINSITLAQAGASDDRLRVSAGRVGSFSVTGKSSEGLGGDLHVNMLLSLNTETIGTLTVKRLLSGDIVTIGAVKDVRAGGLRDLRMSVKSGASTLDELDELFQSGLFLEDLVGITPPPESVINSLVVPRPPASQGFSAINPNLSEFFIFAARINRLDLFTGLSDDANGGERAGIATTSIGKITVRRIGDTGSATNLTADTLLALGGPPDFLPINNLGEAIDASIGPSEDVNDLVLRLFFL